jgi:integral membrane sensor domain MASE1
MGAMVEAARPGRRGIWAEILALALAYYGLGRLAWLLVPIPGQAVALWPAAGLALGLMLLRGLAVWPGAFLGAATLALQAVLMARALPLPRAFLMAAAMGAGATLTPLLGALAVRKFVEMPPRSARDALTFAALAGPAPAALGALACNGVLVWMGLIARQHLAMSIGIWWAGDAMGALAFAPLVLLLGSSRLAVPWRRRFLFTLPVLAATGLAIWVFVRANHWDQRRAENVLRQRTDAITASVQRSLAYHLDTLRAMADFVGTEPKLDPTSFQRVATGAVVRHFSYEALAWAPAPLDQRPVVLSLVEPAASSPGLASGVDLASTPDQAARLSAARHTGEALTLPVAGADGRRIWIFIPAPGRSGEQGIQGFFGAALRLDTMIDRAVAEFGREGVAIELRDAAAPRQLMFRMPSRAGVGPFHALHAGDTTLLVADRTYILSPLVSQAAVVAQQSAEVWVVLLAGMMFVVLLQGVLLVSLARHREEDTVVVPWQPPQHLRTHQR